MPNYRKLSAAELDGKRVLLRAGFDVPMENGAVTDTSRIESIVPTMKYVLSHNASLIIMAHQDRPKGKVVPEMSQKPLVPILEKLLGRSVLFASSCVGKDTKTMVDALAPGQVLLLENLRFDEREEKGDGEFCRELASYADMYVNDAFANCHRSHASMVGVASLLPAYMGLDLEDEISHLQQATERPKKPMTLIISGAKIETKVPVIEHFMKKGTTILLGGAIANTFIGASGVAIGASLVETEHYPKAVELLKKSGIDGNATIRIPNDAIAARDPEQGPSESVDIKDLPENEGIYDIGPKTVEEYEKVLQSSEAIVWNGPLGMYEHERFAQSSIAIARCLALCAKNGALVIVGGGDTIDFHTKYHLPIAAYTFVSKGGGAMLDFVSGKNLPALEPLRA